MNFGSSRVKAVSPISTLAREFTVLHTLILFLQQDNFVKALTKTKVKLEGFVSKANIADPNFVPKMERAISLTKRVVKKKKGGKRSGKAKGEKKKEKKTKDAGSKKKKSKKDKKRKIKRKLVNVRLVPSVFTTR